MEAGKKSINDIFNGNRVLEIPFFQRAYVWAEAEWERLLEDMELITVSNKPYFLGSVILKQQQTPTSNRVGDMRTLIDGQQRLTTLCIFFKVLYLTETNPSFDWFGGLFKFQNKDLALRHNHNDVASFERVLNLEKLEEININGTDNILQAYTFFKDNINPENLNQQTIVNNIMFVGIDLGIEEDEQQIFDTINSLGVRLTTAELLKNYFFNRDLEDYETNWKSVFENDDETKNYWDREITTGRSRRAFIDLFFYAYLQIKIQQPDLKVKGEDKNEFAKVDMLFESYKKLIKEYGLDKKDLIVEIKEYANLFRNNFDYDIISKGLGADFGIERINAIIFGLDASTLIPYVLFVLKNVTDKNQRNELFGFIESYTMRRVVARATNKGYNQFFTSLIPHNIISKEQFQKYLNNQHDYDYVNYLPNDKELEDGFNNSVLRNKQATGIIYLLESKVRDRERHGTQLLGIRNYSLEHLMPKKWGNKWGEVPTKEEEDFRNFKLKTLGNLAIITQKLNASIQNSDWKTKKRGDGQKKGLIHYSGGIETLAPYLDEEEWNEKKIQERTDYLFQKAKEIWKVETS